MIIPEGSSGYLGDWGPLGLRCVQHDTPLLLFGFQRTVTVMGTSKDTMWVSIELSPASLPAQAQGPEPEIQAPGIRQGLLSFGGGVPLLANSQQKAASNSGPGPAQLQSWRETRSAVLTLILSSSS